MHPHTSGDKASQSGTGLPPVNDKASPSGTGLPPANDKANITSSVDNKASELSNTQLNGKCRPVSHKSRSNSGASRSSHHRIKLQLEKLEEERQLQKEYIEKKYALLEQCSVNDELESIGTGDNTTDFDEERVFDWIQEDNLKKPDVNNNLSPNLKCDTRLCTLNDATPLSRSQIAARQVMSKEQIQFSGRPEEWPVFISWWNNSSQACGFNNSEKMIRLQRCLKGKALEAVQFRLLHPDQVDGVINTLKMLFGRPEIIIQTILKRIRNEPPPKYDKLETIVNFSLAVDNMCRVMQITDLSAHLNNPCLLQELVEKLPTQIKLSWGMHKQSISNVDLSVFNDWLAKFASAASEVTLTTPFSSDQKKTRAIINVHQHQKSREENKCPACQKDCKSLVSCQSFLRMELQDRWNLIKQNYICRTCLRRHPNKRCSSSQLCGVGSCTYRHNSLLHKIDDSAGTAANEAQPAQYSGTIFQPNAAQTLFKIVPVVLHYNNNYLETFAFIDDGSSVTLVDEELAFALGAKGEDEPLCLRWTANTHRREDSSMNITFKISAQGSRHKYLLANAHTVKSLDLPRQSLELSILTDQYPHLKGLPIKSYHMAKPQILIGLQHWRLGMPLKSREGGSSQPAAIKTRLGWTLFGITCASTDLRKTSEVNLNVHFCECQNEVDLQMQEAVKQFFSIESVGTKPKTARMSDEDSRAVQMLEERTVFLGDRYAVPLLWKFENVNLPDSRPMAERRLRCLERSLAKQPQLLDKIHHQLEEYLHKGYAKKLSEAEENNLNSRIWYLPIFPVTNPNKPEKIRIVWDAAARVEGVSLNSLLLTGPDSVPALPSVLFRFREKSIAISGDIREMFHQVMILDEDKNAQRFLWRNPSSGSIDVYQMSVMTFGSTCSPFCAQFIKNKNARKFEMQFPRAARAIIENHYVDDWLDSVDTIDEAIALTRDVVHVHKQAGFEIRNFISNSPEVLNALEAKTVKESKAFSDHLNNEFEKLLGMWWSPGTDTFSYAFKSSKMPCEILSGNQIPTKREVLRALMCIFDPLGLIANFTIQLKIILQEIWRSGIDWDEEIKEPQFKRWRTWLSLIPKVKDVTIDRRYLTNLRFGAGNRVELHVFVDAGEDAFAAVAYVRVTSGSEVECSLITAKTKVAPIKTLSIPRLELEAAVLGTRLSRTIRNGHTIHFDSTTFWTDSQVVLSWLKTNNKKFKSYVAVRIGEILEDSNVNDWKWVPSRDNVADDASKYKVYYDFSSSGRWYKGPNFLRQNPIQLPTKISTIPVGDESDEEVKECFIHFEVNAPFFLDYTRFSSWKSLLKTLIFILRFIKLFTLKWRPPSTTPVIEDEREAAEMLLYKQSQKESFNEEYKALVNNASSGRIANIKRNSPLYKLSPYLDNNNVIRIAGRIDAIEGVSSSTKRPIILSKEHPITFLIVDECHQKFRHLFTETVINELRQRYFIPNLRRVLKKVIQNCQYCKNRNAVPQPPIMGELPYARLQPFQRPFSFTGVDYFGPLYVKIGRRLDKRWGMLLTCLTVRAIHIEIVHSLSSDACILAFKRFVDRRGMPKEVYSDNATNFKGANNELQQALKDLNKHAIANKFELQLKWFFIPPAAPHMGGCWERMVRSVKQVLNEISPTRNPSDELLLSMMTEVESIVNSRPLTYVPIESDNDEALTPNHLLIGCPNEKSLTMESPCDGAALKRSWLAAEKYAHSFWQRWVREYLPDLTRRTKWFEPQRELQEGDVVVVVDSNNPKKSWPKGRVLRTIPGKDGLVRSAVVQSSSGIYTRPTAKLAVLDVHKLDDEGKPAIDPVTGGSVKRTC